MTCASKQNNRNNALSGIIRYLESPSVKHSKSCFHKNQYFCGSVQTMSKQPKNGKHFSVGVSKQCPNIITYFRSFFLIKAHFRESLKEINFFVWTLFGHSHRNTAFCENKIHFVSVLETPNKCWFHLKHCFSSSAWFAYILIEFQIGTLR